MISKEQEKQVLDSLDELLVVTDVYFHKGKLYVINEYDVEAVEEYLDETGWAADVEMVAPESYDPFDTVNS